MSTEMVHVGGSIATAIAPNIGPLTQLAQFFAGFDILPKRMSVADAMIAAAAGARFNMDPMTSLMAFHVVEGKPTMAADAMAAIIIAHPLCEDWRWTKTDSTVAALRVQRRGKEPELYRYTIEEARTAGLANKHNWKAHTAAMLRARCTTIAGRAAFPDIVFGLYSREEMADSGLIEPPDVIDAEFTEEPQQPMRRQSTPPRRVEGDADAGGRYEPNDDGPQGYEGLVYFIEHLGARAAFNAYLKAKAPDAATPQTLDSIRAWAAPEKFDEQQELISAALPNEPITHESVWATIKRHLGAALGRPPVAAELSALRSRIRWADESLGERDHALACCLLAARCVRKPETLRLRLGLEVAS